MTTVCTDGGNKVAVVINALLQGELRCCQRSSCSGRLHGPEGTLIRGDYGFTEMEAYMLLTQAGKVRLGNMVDPKYTLGASIAKALLNGDMRVIELLVAIGRGLSPAAKRGRFLEAGSAARAARYPQARRRQPQPRTRADTYASSAP